MFASIIKSLFSPSMFLLFLNQLSHHPHPRTHNSHRILYNLFLPATPSNKPTCTHTSSHNQLPSQPPPIRQLLCSFSISSPSPPASPSKSLHLSYQTYSARPSPRSIFLSTLLPHQPPTTPHTPTLPFPSSPPITNHIPPLPSPPRNKSQRREIYPLPQAATLTPFPNPKQHQPFQRLLALPPTLPPAPPPHAPSQRTIEKQVSLRVA